MPNIESIGVKLNLSNPADRTIYDKLQNYPSGERSKIIKEALLRYLDDTDGGKGTGSKVQEVKRASRGKEVISSYKDKPAPTHAAVETIENSVPAKAEKGNDGGNDTEDTRSKLRNLVY